MALLHCVHLHPNEDQYHQLSLKGLCFHETQPGIPCGCQSGRPTTYHRKRPGVYQKADVIIYDYLVNVDLLKVAKQTAEFIYVGKQGGAHTMEQEDINDLIVKRPGKIKL